MFDHFDIIAPFKIDNGVVKYQAVKRGRRSISVWP
ncbi:MAG: hypothetical protein SRB2_00949 [Desulfobacteraceae bacterium Eth-SRB2]|nr:MAG: hypothetical protein SRB2_00949 [Desulfobacteraceae bacterium Eth-SRB2]